MTDSPSISLVFVNYRSVFSLSLALKSLFSFEKNRTLFEVIVVNNDSEEEQALLALGEKLPLRICSLKENAGYGTAANVGGTMARGSLIGFINPDTEWRQEMLADILRFFKQRNSESILGIHLLSDSGQPELHSHGQAPSMRTLIRQNLPLNGFIGNAQPRLDWVSAAALFLPKSLFQKLNGFDEGFFLYFEDVDMCLRAKEQDADIHLHDQFSLVHHGGKSFTSNEQQKQFFHNSQRRYYAKHRPSWEHLLLQVLQGLFLKS